MKIVLLADLHGNMTATEAMERELDQRCRGEGT